MMRFSLSNLRLRLLGGFLLVVIMTVVAGGGGIFALHKIHTNMAAVTVEVSGSIERQRRHIGRAMKVRDLIDEINRVGDLFGVDQVATHLHNYAEENRTSTHDQGCESIGFLEQLLVLRSRQLKAAAERSQLSRVAEKQLREIDSYVAQTVDDLTFDALIAMEDTLKEVQRKPLEGVMDFRGRFERFSSTTDQAISQIKSALAIRSYSLQLHVVVKNVLLSSDPPYVDYALEQLRTLHRNVDSELHRLPEADATRLLAASLEDIQKVTPDLLLAQKEMIISEQAVQQKSEELSQSTVRMNADMLAKADELVESVIGKQEENARFIGRYRIALFLVAASACLVGIICSRQMLRAIARDIEARKRAAEARDLVNDRQAKLNRLQQSLLGSDELSEKLKRITDGVVDIFGADFCRIWITQPGDRCESGCMHADITEGPHVCRYRDRCLWLRASSGRYTHIDGEVHKRVPFGCYKIGLVASGENSKFLTNEAATDPRVHNNAWAKELGLVSFAGYQLRPPNGETIGVLALFAKHAIAPDEDALLESLGSTAAQVIQKARAEEEVTERNRFLNSVLESLTHPFVVIDAADYSVLMANSAARRNAPPAAETCHAMTHRRDTPCDGGEHVCPLVEIKRTGKPITVEHTHYDADGNPRTSEVHAYPILDNTGRVVQGIEYSV
ncbi:MAG: GAF domain-containing protein, partial [Planctomycetota bacterium]